MTKDEYREKICPSCVNYNYKRQGELCGKFGQFEEETRCKNYRKWSDCVAKNCRACRMCEGE